MNKRTFFKTGILGTVSMLLPSRLFSLEFYPRRGDKKWAILYSSWCGSARDAAVWISEGMDGIANVFDVREKPDLSDYDFVVAGGAIRSGKVSPEMEKFLEAKREMLKNKLKGYFAVCGNMMKPAGPEQTRTLIDEHLAKICGVAGLPSKVFLGRITFGLMEPDVREQMQSMPGMKDYDNLKRSECMDFGKELLKA